MKTQIKTTFKKIMLDDLKSQGQFGIVSKIKSITYETFAGGDSVRVKAFNLSKTEREFMTNFLREYTDGKFDGMTDMYNYHSGPSTKIRTAKYASLSHEYTPDLYEKAKVILLNEWGITDDETSQAKRRCWYNEAVYRELREMEL